MKGIALCPKGFEDISSNEIKELIKEDCIIKDGIVIFNIKNIDQLAKLTYLSRSLSKVMFLLNSFTYDDINSSIKKNLMYDEINKWINQETFRVNTIKLIELDKNSTEISSETGKFIVEKINVKADMENPKIILTNIITKEEIFNAIDFSGIDLSKRDYKIYNYASSLNGSFAYCILKSSNWNNKKSIIDPMCGSGTITIEAALEFSNKSPQYYRKDKLAFTKLLKFDFDKYDKIIENTTKNSQNSNIYCFDYLLNCLNTSKNNAKIADVDKFINFSKCDLEWLETKIDENSIDCIATNPPDASKNVDFKKIKKTYDELFYQSEFILKKKGIISLITRSKELIIESAKKYKFKIIKEKEVWQGKQKFDLIIFEK
jgi:putative N6-adenine-specific DNA methylase